MQTDPIELAITLNKTGEVSPLQKSANIFVHLINGIKVGLVNYPYPWIDDELKDGDLRLAGKRDIAAMKLSAITGRGTKKDFIDLYYLLGDYSLNDIIQFYNQKYYDGSEFLVLKSLTYFEDAEKDEMPKMFERVFWPEIKEAIRHAVDAYLNL